MGGGYRRLRRLGLATAIAAGSIAGAAADAVAAPRPVPAWYVTSASTATAYNHGCDTGRAHLRGLVALFLGGPQGSQGTILVFTNQSVSLKDDAAVARAFARGYVRCLSKRYRDAGYRIVLSLNTNNSTGSSNVGFESGRAWGKTVKAVGAYVARKKLSRHVRVAGGSDLEPGFGPPGPARAYVRGFTSATRALFYNTGSSDGCPPAPVAGDGMCAGGWHQSDLYYVSWGRRGTRALPEIYVPDHPKQWALISRLGASASKRGKIVFSGVLSQHRRSASSFTADAAWNALRDALSQYPSTSQRRLAYSTYLNEAW